jgi:hypothetical protein
MRAGEIKNLPTAVFHRSGEFPQRNTGRRIIETGGDPADIAVETKRDRVAVPFVARNLVEIWQLPAR